MALPTLCSVQPAAGPSSGGDVVRLEGNASSDGDDVYGEAVTVLADLACGIAGIATTPR